MNYAELNEKLKQLRGEKVVWLIYIGIIIMSWYANQLERKYFINNDINSKEKYRKMMILIFSVLIIVYLYFFQESFNDLQKLKSRDSEKKKNLTFLSFIGTFLIVISGFIFLYISVMDESIDVELAFS